MECPRCVAGRLVQINLTAGERKLTMRSCSKCDTRWWDSEGESLHLPKVLELATSRR